MMSNSSNVLPKQRQDPQVQRLQERRSQNDRNLHRTMDSIHRRQHYKLNQKKDLEKIAAIERDFLERTVFVWQVQDLNQLENREQLQHFFQQAYGPVEVCLKTRFTTRSQARRFNRRQPPARLRFVRKQDAEKIFKTTLMQARKQKEVQLDGCPVASTPGGSILVKPIDPYPGMAEGALQSYKLHFKLTKLAFGNWSDATLDTYHDLAKQRWKIHPQWLEEYSCNSKMTPAVCIDLRRRVLEMHFPNEYRENDTVLRPMLILRLKDIAGHMDLVAESHHKFSWFFQLKQPPKIYMSGYDRDAYEIRRRWTHLEGASSKLNVVSQCLGYKFTLDKEAMDMLAMNVHAVERLRNFGVIRDGPLVPVSSEQIEQERIQTSTREVFEKEFQKIKDRKTGLLLRSLVDSGKVFWYHALHDQIVSKDGFSWQNIFMLVAAESTIMANMVLQRMLDTPGSTRAPARTFKELRDSMEMIVVSEADDEENLRRKIPSYCIEVPRILLTPTREVAVGFGIEISNRVVRHYTKYDFQIEAFVRVLIGDENGDQLYASEISNEVERSIKMRLERGLYINGHMYEFLAYSPSQLKEFSLWMVHPAKGYSVKEIVRQMGDFSVCENAPKKAARMGQCLSNTVEVIQSQQKRSRPVDPHAGQNSSLQVFDLLKDAVSFARTDAPGGKVASATVFDRLPDIVTCDQNGRETCHSDGTGLIRRDILEKCIEMLPFGVQNPEDVSIIQIRFGGAKGTLVAWDFDKLKRLAPKDYDIYLRPSMVKFSAPYQSLEVTFVGQHVAYYLNRNVILLLLSHGVKKQTFVDMQKEMLDELDGCLKSSEIARDILPRLGGTDSTIINMLIDIMSCDSSPEDEPFLFSCIDALRTHKLTELRRKWGILIRKGAVLMGSIDESGLVPEGCVYVQVRECGYRRENDPLDDKAKGDSVPLTGPVMVTKHPVMHPGDLRMLLAVDIPELRHHRNVILFSRHDIRPEADKDDLLDGDQFAITWDERLFLGQWNGCKKQDGVWISSKGDRLLSRSMKKDSKLPGRVNRHQPSRRRKQD